MAYWSAWLVSVLLIYVTLSGRYDKAYGNWQKFILRPLFLPHWIFATYMAITSVFAYLSANGYFFFTREKIPELQGYIEYIIAAQKYYLAGHIGLFHGLVLTNQYGQKSFKFNVKSISRFTLNLAVVIFLFVLVFSAIPALSQVAVKFKQVSLVASIIALSLSIPERNRMNMLKSGFLFGFNLYQAIFSGWKESIFILFILAAAFIYPYHKRLVTLLAIPTLAILILVLPTFVGEYRIQMWRKSLDSDTAANIAFEKVQTQQFDEYAQETWMFFTARLSEIDLFTDYLRNIPRIRPFYEFQIIEQGFLNLIPRAFYPDKPDTEQMVMKRVRENTVVEWYSKDVSAKPQLVVDGFLSFGLLGAWLFCFLAGLGAGRISVLSEKLFGGYLFGTGLFFTGLFSVFWRGNCFEFMLNTILWSLVILYLFFFLFRRMGFLVKV